MEHNIATVIMNITSDDAGVFAKELTELLDRHNVSVQGPTRFVMYNPRDIPAMLTFNMESTDDDEEA